MGDIAVEGSAGSTLCCGAMGVGTGVGNAALGAGGGSTALIPALGGDWGGAVLTKGTAVQLCAIAFGGGGASFNLNAPIFRIGSA